MTNLSTRIPQDINSLNLMRRKASEDALVASLIETKVQRLIKESKEREQRAQERVKEINYEHQG